MCTALIVVGKLTIFRLHMLAFRTFRMVIMMHLSMHRLMLLENCAISVV